MPHLPDLTANTPASSAWPTPPSTPLSSTASPSPASQSSSHTAFRQTERHFKNRSNPQKLPSLRNQPVPVLDPSRPPSQDVDKVWKAGWWSPASEVDSRPRRKGKARELGERPEQDLEGLGLKRIGLGDGKIGWVVAEGCVLVPGYLDSRAQLELLRAALSEYTLRNPLSLSTHYALPPNLFDLYARGSEELVLPLHQVQPIGSTEDQPAGPRGRQTIETEPGAVMGYEEIVARNKAAANDRPSDKLKPRTAGELMREIRWANLGWVYQWTTKSYDLSQETPIPFPEGLRRICTEVVRDVPWGEVFEPDQGVDYASWADDYAPDTGIVNFYQLNDTLMGHVDRAELDPSRPLVSLSLGHACVFLLGTTSRQDPPRPIVLRSGDVLIMSGKGRQFYHGVPRIMEGTLPDTFAPEEGDDLVMAAAKRWIASARININARQVFPPGFQRPVTDQ